MSKSTKEHLRPIDTSNYYEDKGSDIPRKVTLIWEEQSGEKHKRQIVTRPHEPLYCCPFENCSSKFQTLWRLRVHVRAKKGATGSGVPRGHASELSRCPKCGATLAKSCQHTPKTCKGAPYTPHCKEAAGQTAQCVPRPCLAHTKMADGHCTISLKRIRKQDVMSEEALPGTGATGDYAGSADPVTPSTPSKRMRTEPYAVSHRYSVSSDSEPRGLLPQTGEGTGLQATQLAPSFAPAPAGSAALISSAPAPAHAPAPATDGLADKALDELLGSLDSIDFSIPSHMASLWTDSLASQDGNMPISEMMVNVPIPAPDPEDILGDFTLPSLEELLDDIRSDF